MICTQTVKESLTVRGPDEPRRRSVARGSALLGFQRDIKAAQQSGNYAATTTAGLRVAVCSSDPAAVSAYLLTDMGISAEVAADGDGLLVGFGRYSHHSHATVLRALQGAFRVVGAMTEDGRQAIKIFVK